VSAADARSRVDEKIRRNPAAKSVCESATIALATNGIVT
jgi:hypothetical protein